MLSNVLNCPGKVTSNTEITLQMASGTQAGKVYKALHDEQHMLNIKWTLNSYTSDKGLVHFRIKIS